MIDVIVGILSQYFPLDSIEIAPEARLLEDLGFDSIMVFEFALLLEDEFDVEIPDDMLANFVSPASAAEIVSALALTSRND